MITIRVLQAETDKWIEKLATTGDLPLGLFKGKPKATKLAQKCAIALGYTFPHKRQRLQAIQTMFQLPYRPSSTYELTVAQAYALRNIAYSGHKVTDEFVQFAEHIKEEIAE